MKGLKLYTSAWGASAAHFISKQYSQGDTLIIIVPDQSRSITLYNELILFSNSIDINIFPEYPIPPYEPLRFDPDIAGRRINVLKKLLDCKPGIYITTMYAMIRKLPSKDFIKTSGVTLFKDKVFPRAVLLSELDRMGYLPVEFVNGRGEFCVRGGVIDIFPPILEYPIRLEYFDDEIELLFHYNIETQKSISAIDAVDILPVSEVLYTLSGLLTLDLKDEVKRELEDFGKFAGYEWLIGSIYDNYASFVEFLPSDSEIFFTGENYKEYIQRQFITVNDATVKNKLTDTTSSFVSEKELSPIYESFPFSCITDISNISEEPVYLNYRSIKSRFVFDKKDLYTSLTNALNELNLLHSQGISTIVAMESERFISLLRSFCIDHEIPIKDIDSYDELAPLTLCLYKSRISAGFLSEQDKLALITDEDIFGYVRKKRAVKAKEVFDTSLSDLEAGDYVVHTEYGIGIYKGLKHMVLGGIEGDYLELLYDNNDTLFAPLEQIGLIQKYVGVGDSKPKLSNMQSNVWSKLKESAKKQALRIAQDLLKLYADRKVNRGFSFTGGEDQIVEFERRFEYDETEDQLSAIHDIYKDMQRPYPMERLVCGDVGFGKTEVAMRAAFRAVLSGKQVSVLVPTTVLARQHFNTFKARFADFPVNIDYVSRFRTSKEIKAVKEGLHSGAIDIVIGTHRILSKDIIFKDLGLLIIDEEQRFGVADKEKIASLRSNIDVLSLSATPIPRTLQLSLSGVREISIIETPPANRKSVVVKVLQKDEEIQKAVEHELERGGQIFYLHNRVRDIHDVYEYLKKLAPKASIAIAHGKLNSKELDTILSSFYSGAIDILISTTIIENGIDIANVNAIFIDKASHYGLSQLYQLKGRVGRGAAQGYCYLLVDDYLTLEPLQKKRLSIIQQLSDLGSGLKIAMYDLQLRGAGDILGAAQSGFVTKVGFELFVKMISEAVSELQNVTTTVTQSEIITQFPYYIAADYIEDPRIRLDYYRHFSLIENESDMIQLFDTLDNEYGPVRAETINLGRIMLIKYLCSKLKIDKADIYLKQAKFHFAPRCNIEPETMYTLLNNSNHQYRFAGEYQLVMIFENSEETLTSIMTFLQALADRESNMSMSNNNI